MTSFVSPGLTPLQPIVVSKTITSIYSSRAKREPSSNWLRIVLASLWIFPPRRALTPGPTLTFLSRGASSPCCATSVPPSRPTLTPCWIKKPKKASSHYSTPRPLTTIGSRRKRILPGIPLESIMNSMGWIPVNWVSGMKIYSTVEGYPKRSSFRGSIGIKLWWKSIMIFWKLQWRGPKRWWMEIFYLQTLWTLKSAKCSFIIIFSSVLRWKPRRVSNRK